MKKATEYDEYEIEQEVPTVAVKDADKSKSWDYQFMSRNGGLNVILLPEKAIVGHNGSRRVTMPPVTMQFMAGIFILNDTWRRKYYADRELDDEKALKLMYDHPAYGTANYNFWFDNKISKSDGEKNWKNATDSQKKVDEAMENAIKELKK